MTLPDELVKVVTEAIKAPWQIGDTSEARARLAVAAVLRAQSYERDSTVSVLKTARDFIAHHPAVQGEWPLLLELLDSAIAKLADDD